MNHPTDRPQDTKQLVIVGSGFAGVWAAMSAARRARALRVARRIEITVVSPEPFLDIRPRLYESDLDSMRVELANVLAPIGVAHRAERVVSVDVANRTVHTEHAAVRYDALVWATGSALARPSLPGADLGHDVDTWHGARALDAHLVSLAANAGSQAAATVVVVGAGFTGLEVAAEMHDRLRAVLGTDAIRVILVERVAEVAPEFGPDARTTIERALAAMDIEVRTSTSVVSVEPGRVVLDDGDTIAASTVVWTGGVRAIAETASIASPADPQGRLAVDEHLQVLGAPGVWAAGDAARALVDGEHLALMSCQHAMPQGSYAGHNAVNALFGRAQRRYEQHAYSTCLDLGSWGALVTTGFDRNRVVASEHDAKKLKQFINRSLIYPPLGDADALRKAGKLPNGGKVSAVAMSKLLASPTARALATRRGADGPEALRASRASASEPRDPRSPR